MDFFFFLFVAWLVFLAILHRPTPTDKLRAVFDAVVFLLVPYLAVSRLIRTTEEMKHALLALVFTGIIVTFIGLMEQRMTWYFYQSVPGLLKMNALQGFEGAHDVRFGLLRIRSSVGGGLGYVLVFSLCACLCLGRMRAAQRLATLHAHRAHRRCRAFYRLPGGLDHCRNCPGCDSCLFPDQVSGAVCNCFLPSVCC